MNCSSALWEKYDILGDTFLLIVSRERKILKSNVCKVFKEALKTLFD